MLTTINNHPNSRVGTWNRRSCETVLLTEAKYVTKHIVVLLSRHQASGKQVTWHNSTKQRVLCGNCKKNKILI